MLHHATPILFGLQLPDEIELQRVVQAESTVPAADRCILATGEPRHG
jgi:hypothetical protein